MCVYKNANCSPLTGGAGEAGVTGVARRNASPAPNSRFRGIRADFSFKVKTGGGAELKIRLRKEHPARGTCSSCEVSAVQVTELLWIIKSARTH